MQAKISIQLIALTKPLSSHMTCVRVYVFTYNTSKSRLNKISRLKEPQRVYNSANKIPNSLHKIHWNTSQQLT